MSADRHWLHLLQQAVSPLESGVRDLQVTGYRPPDSETYRPNKTAAVLVPVIEQDEPEIVLTRRADHLPQHPGQVSFPGGAADESDRTAVQTALREAYEEIGLPPDVARPIGFLDRMDTVSDYRVLPVVALVPPRIEWVLDTREVAEVFTVPLDIALDAKRYSTVRVERNGQMHTVFSLEWASYKIWGATAAMLMNLVSRMERIRARQDSAVSD